jgi:N-acetylneuraminic acid mutarotase
MYMKVPGFLAASLASFLLAACSGGGGSSSSPPPPPPPAPPPVTASVPVISTPPGRRQVVVENTPVTLSVVATGNGTLTYQWRRRTADIPGATAASFTIANVTAADNASYDCVVTNTLGTTSQTATSELGEVIPVLLPVVRLQPRSFNVFEGVTIRFRISAAGNGTNSYVWRHNGQVLPGGDDGYELVNVTAANAGNYQVSVTNTLEGVTTPSQLSSVATIAITPVPVLRLSAEQNVLAASSGHVASVPAQAGVSFMWKLTNGTITSGQGTSTIQYTAGQPGDARIAVIATVPMGSFSAARDQRVVPATALPLAGIFAPPVVHPGARDIRASAATFTGNTYSWSTQDLGATALVSGSLDGGVLTYSVGNTVGQYTITASVQDAANNASVYTRTLNVASNVFLRDNDGPAARIKHTATLLDDGRVLVVGGDAGIPDLGLADPSSPLSPIAGARSRIVGTVEIFDPATRRWVDAPSIDARFGHSATRLIDGRVLVVGGADQSNNYLASGAIYQPSSGTWSASGSLQTGRAQHVATLLTDGRVLVLSGKNASGIAATAEIYDPVTNSWMQTGSPATPRSMRSAVRLDDGRVLVGGPEFYDPSTGQWSAPAARNYGGGGVLLGSGKVLQMGDLATYDPVTNFSEILGNQYTGRPLIAWGDVGILLHDGTVLASGGGYDDDYKAPAGRVNVGAPSANLLGDSYANTRYGGTATLLADGDVLFVGGAEGVSDRWNSRVAYYWTRGFAQLWNPGTDTNVLLGFSAHPGAQAVWAPLADGKFLFAGGRSDDTSAGDAATIYDSANNQWTEVASMSVGRSQAAAAALTGGRVLVVGGYELGGGAPEYFDPASNTWAAAGVISRTRFRHTLTALPDGGAIAVGGVDRAFCDCAMAIVDRYDAVSNSWSPTSPLATRRERHTATTLPDGRVLVTGGYGGGVLASSELYDPRTGSWTATGWLNTARSDHMAISLGGGRVLVAGGEVLVADGSSSGFHWASLASAEIYDVSTGVWTPVASMHEARRSAQIAMLPGGRVLVANGVNETSNRYFGTGAGEVYDPVANTWSTPVPTAVPRLDANAISLPDGRVMIVGGGPNHAGLPEFYR